MHVMVTGACGQIGRHLVRVLCRRGHAVYALDRPSSHRKPRLPRRASPVWADVRDPSGYARLMPEVDAVCHLAAIIPPKSDIDPELSWAVNVEGTRQLVRAIEASGRPIKLLYTSSVALYGDRRSRPMIACGEATIATPHDPYTCQKLAAERIVRESTLTWAVFRLTFILSAAWLRLDPLMFRVPLDTPLEVCFAEDVAVAIANALDGAPVWKRVLDIGGGTACRTFYRDFLARTMALVGIGTRPLPDVAFCRQDFHCGFMDTTESNALLRYQRHTLGDFYAQIGRRFRARRVLLSVVRPLARWWLLSQSAWYKRESRIDRRSGRLSSLFPRLSMPRWSTPSRVSLAPVQAPHPRFPGSSR